jgi:hypothetical protein
MDTKLGKKMKRTKEMWMFGIGFWAGAGVYSLINLLMNLKGIPTSKILNYNYIITAVAIAGLILNIILFKKTKQK